MYQVNSQALISRMQSDVRGIILTASQLKEEQSALLEWSPGSGRWSVAQVLEHLNVYARFYLGAMEKALHLNQSLPVETFRSGWLGDYFTRLMQPPADGSPVKKMKAPSNAKPSVSPDAAVVLAEFISHQYHLLNVLEIARHADLNGIRVPTSLSRFIRLKLGDTIRFLVAHQERHMLQITRTLEEAGKQSAHAGIRKVA